MEDKTNRPEPTLNAEAKPAPTHAASKKYEIKRNNNKKFIIAGILVVVVLAGIAFATFTLTRDNDAKDNKAVIVSEDESERSLFTIVVNNKEGEIIMAGRNTEPGARVVILADGEEIGKSTDPADENGEWVFFPTNKLKPGNRELTAYYVNKAGKKISSSEVVSVNVPDAADKKGDWWATKIDKKTGKAEVLTAPKGDIVGELKLRAVDYNEKGRLGVSGVGKKGSIIQVYLDNVLIAKTTVDKNDRFRVDMKKTLKSKEYLIRVDMIKSGNKVAARIEQKFKPSQQTPTGAKKYIVKKGDNLWNIARHEYGRGYQWVVVFKDNMKQIKDPDKIYPGQVLTIPSKKEADKMSKSEVKALTAKSKKSKQVRAKKTAK